VDGEQSYLVHHTREWAAGLAQRRIDGLLALLPLSTRAPYTSTRSGCRRRSGGELATMRKIVRYWRDRGVDVTGEA